MAADDNNDDARPKIQSLEEYQVELTEEVESYLIDLYTRHYAKVASTSQEEANHVASEQLAAAHSTAESHVARFRRRMKWPPSQTVLRITSLDDHNSNDRNIDNRRDELIQHLKQTLTAWIEDANASDFILPNVKQHALFKDVVTVDLVQSASKPGLASLRSCRVPHLGLYPQLFQNDDAFTYRRKTHGWPLTHRAVLVDRHCGEAVLRGANIFVKGILAADAGVRSKEHVAVYAHVGNESLPRGMVLTSSSNNNFYRGNCIFLGLGRTCCDRAQFFSQSTGVGVELSVLPWETAGPVLPPLHHLLREKGLFAQNLPSVMVGHVLDPQEGDCIYDMCGAPGGKTSHLAALLSNKATIVMSDKSRSKVVACQSLFQDMGCGGCIYPIALDATKSVLADADDTKGLTVRQLLEEAKPSEKDGLLEITGFPREVFDKILLDPPCSALGLRPKLGVSQSKVKDLMSFANYQKRFLRQAVNLLRPGGTMTFSTCTTHAMENEANVHFLLEEFADTMELLPISIDLGSPGLLGFGLNSEQCQRVRRFDSFDTTNESDPNEDVMGFFIAKLRKKRSIKKVWFN